MDETAVSLTDAKAHLRIDGSASDADVRLKLNAAVAHARDICGGTLPGEEYSPPAPLPWPVKAAILLILGDLYENREGQIVGTISEPNAAVMNLLFPYRRDVGV